MSAAVVATVVLLVWVAGALVLVLLDVDLTRADLLALAAWPVLVPVAQAVKWWRHRAYTCRDCGGYYGDADTLRLHLRHRTDCSGEARP